MTRFGTAIILAGGKSSRMGFDKQFLNIDENRLMENVIANLKLEFQDIIIVTNKPEEYKNWDCRITKDIYKDKGPLGGIHAGLSISKSKYAFVVACDMPNINIDYIRYMMEKMGDKKLGIITEIEGYIEPFSSFYSRELLEDMEEYIINCGKSIARFLRNKDIDIIGEEKVREFSPDLELFLNLNTKEDLERYIKYLQ